MADHYYSKKPGTESAPQTWTATLRGIPFRFKTDAGVFSKQSVDFGSRLLIDTFREPAIPGNVLDIGCGYGPVGLTAARLMPDRVVHMVDVNSRALGLARENAGTNGAGNTEIYESDAGSDVRGAGFSAILTNPPIRAGKDTVFRIYEDAFRLLAEGGELWVVIQKKQGAASTEKKLQELFGNVTAEAKKKGYFIYRSLKK
ncbi:class I SAM-dependent methyltransferase [Bhargavaea beijingensis]|uniref:16S rRNA (Guanine1207-N2)-methyltransferase n=1 Tax=Bhargavaea beijingensis TaxID=426756 RepID=A0A1G6XRZ7_9BACL|nr:class I SAM-dependent methyltransferase [Bhargavaea beijingensis]MCW1927992.1 class I SAM-dependent methyltransferase [Bhargavaea beijingensis]RSK25082.1 class I SAM-dependent methyltransferase [Bhargavaea beijingensis]SDD80910.1 16S rRNA (guanine1207-N2)-methyltransferase [Bhargavaea beijingensis]